MLVQVPEKLLDDAVQGCLPRDSGPGGRLPTAWAQLTAFFRRAMSFFSTAGVSLASAYDVGHRSPSSRLADWSKPKVAYRDLNFAASWKKQRTLPFFAQAGMPYQSLGVSSGAASAMITCRRSAIARSASFIAAIFAAWAAAGSSLPLSSLARSFIASRSASVKPSYDLALVPVFFVVAMRSSCLSVLRCEHPQRYKRPSWRAS